MRASLLLALLVTGCARYAPPGDKVDSGADSGTDVDGDGFPVGTDCDDERGDVNPDAVEICDGIDNDCSGEIDDAAADAVDWYPDADGDGYGLTAGAVSACDAPQGTVADPGDCDDGDPAVHPDAPEACDGLDNDCDGEVDDGVSGGSTWYRDADGDGQGNAAVSLVACVAPAGYVATSTDCNDAEETIYLGADERCDGVDDDCDGASDEADSVDAGVYYRDADGDGAGDPETPLTSCGLPDGYARHPDDCDDTDATAFPANPEVCDGVDNDCNGAVDDGLGESQSWYADADGDGFGDAADSIYTCEAPDGYIADDSDCDDADPDAFPGNVEVTDGVDNDCDGEIDEATVCPTWYYDTDGDGYGDDTTAVSTCTPDAALVSAGGDCDDADPAVSPGAHEICDGVDDNCDGRTDEGWATYPWYADADVDGYGDPAVEVDTCLTPVGYVSNPDDCDDTDAGRAPSATETCDGVDEDCDGVVDDGFATTTWHPDVDGDGYGLDTIRVNACAAPAGYVVAGGDCDDTDAGVSPSATETCDGVDEDCDGTVDDGFPTSTWYFDGDGDGYGLTSRRVTACAAPVGFVGTPGDCNDAEILSNPGQVEVCDYIDNDCDGRVDDGVAPTTVYADVDGDGYGDDATAVTTCSPPAGYVTVGGDCDDGSAAASPALSEVCDGVDNDCDGRLDDGLFTRPYYQDADGDGYGTSTVINACAPPAGYALATGDCDDTTAAANPGRAEVCDFIDDDCDGSVDEGVAPGTWYTDADGDGYGVTASAVVSCTVVAGASLLGGDCDDTTVARSPVLPESCDGVDNDCDGVVDDGLPSRTWYRDADGDSYGDAADTLTACAAPAGYVLLSGDCDDTSPTRSPAVPETCDGVDNDCDGTVDDGLAVRAWYTDADADGYGLTGSVAYACAAPSGTSSVDGDCDDTTGVVNPGAAETCDGVDDDCDGAVDEDLSVRPYYLDADGDGYGVGSVVVVSCVMPAGYATAGGDCDDTSTLRSPGVAEVCDGIDNDCDGAVDNGATPRAWYQDADGDAYGDSSVTVVSCAAPAGYVSVGGDCDDTSAVESPGRTETCDALDNDCDGIIDDGVATRSWYPDADGDGYGETAAAVSDCAAPVGYLSVSGDCDDANAAVSPAAAEACDGIDNDCNGRVDDGSLYRTWYRDSDGDGYGDPTDSTGTCSTPAGFVLDDQDCNDTAADVHPGAPEADCHDPVDYNCDGSSSFSDADADGSPACEDCDDANPDVQPGGFEVCDGLDNDCNGVVDDDSGTVVYFEDLDGDGHGDPTSFVYACSVPAGYAAAGDDCDDADPSAYPGGAEICDGFDNDCDGVADDGAVDAPSWYADADGDAFGSATSTVSACAQPVGYVSDATDCNDTNDSVSPADVEYCDGVDNDCDGAVDDAAVDRTTWYADADGDGYGVSSPTVSACTAPAGYAASTGDCNDARTDIHPGAPETSCVDTTDYNCDGSVTATDADHDGYPACTDCNDRSSAAHPGASEICGGGDEDCDGLVDDADPSVTGRSTYWPDSDHDGYGASSAAGSTVCSRPASSTTNNGDCNDVSAAVNPSATEVCDRANVDEDCDGAADDADSSVDHAGYSRYYRDADGDGFGDLTRNTSQCDAPASYVSDHTDCDDTNPARYPTATEVCDVASIDEDCDGAADDADASATGQSTFYYDVDGDDYGGASGGALCHPPVGTSLVGGDCADDDDAINPGVPEVCDDANVDENCNGLSDDNDPSATGQTDWFADADSDGYGADVGMSTCEQPVGYITTTGDCDDTDVNVNPSETELCDAGDVDENCDGLVDDADPGAVGQSTWYADVDGDGYAGSTVTLDACEQPAGYDADPLDCDDARADVSPAGAEVCDPDEADEDCDGVANDSDPSVTGQSTFYQDADADGYGNVAEPAFRCYDPSGYVADATDCDDTLPDAHAVQVWYADVDGDGYGDPAVGVSSCAQPPGYVLDATDCDDANVDVHVVATWYLDADGDDYGVASPTLESCDPPAGYGAYTGDCDDADPARSPGNRELCGDLIDNDCDLTVDEACSLTGDIDVADVYNTLYTGTSNTSYLGISVVGMDWDRDGSDELVVGAELDDTFGTNLGVVYVLDADTTGDDRAVAGESTLARFYGSSGYTHAGSWVADVGDATGDGVSDLVVGASANYTHFIPGGLTGDMTTLTADFATVVCSTASTAGDVGAAYDAWMCGYAGYSSYTGQVRVFAQAGTSVGNLVGDVAGDDLGAAVAGGDDVNGDGLDDLWLGALLSNRGASDAGAVYLVEAPIASGNTRVSDAASSVIVGTQDSQQLGSRLTAAHDVNGDGYGDVYVGAYNTTHDGNGTGAVYLFDSPHGASLTPSDAAVTVYGSHPQDNLGYRTYPIVTGDLNEDGQLDLVVGSPIADSPSASNVGATWILYGPLAGTYDLSNPSDYGAGLYGSTALDYFGQTADIVTDLTGDGFTDLVVGAAQNPSGSIRYAGGLYLFAGSP